MSHSRQYKVFIHAYMSVSLSIGTYVYVVVLVSILRIYYTCSYLHKYAHAYSYMKINACIIKHVAVLIVGITIKSMAS